MRLLVTLALILCAGPALAADPVAIVEDAKGKLDVDFMDYVEAGRVVKLGANDELVLSYLRSCWRETIKGGTVTVGAEQSAVAGGTVKREKTPCDGGKMRLSSDQAAKSGVMVFRAPPKPTAAAATPEMTIYGLSPVLDIKGGGHVTIARVDQPGEPMAFDVPAQQLMRGSFYDLAKANKALAAGGIYRLTAAGKQIVFKVDPEARPGQAPLVGRLIRL
ncbi:MAG: hypothetical protein GC202_07220 [Alphaproteobacteria bacterium]|nr:hypothetical protein [Alphaproteobacteria bacterium]